MSVSPCLGTYVNNVLVGSIKNKSFLILVSFLINLQEEDPQIIEIKALVDSGAGGKFIDQNLSKRMKLKLKKLKKKLPVFNVNGTLNKRGTICQKVHLPLKVGDKLRKVTLFITGLGKQKIILGQPWLKKENPDINWKKGTLTWREDDEDKEPTEQVLESIKEEINLVSLEQCNLDQEDLNSLMISYLRGEPTEKFGTNSRPSVR